MSSSWNSSQAARYQRLVQPAGSQVPSQRVANELVTTVAIIAKRLRTKKPTSVQTVMAQSRAASVVSRITGTLPPCHSGAARRAEPGTHDQAQPESPGRGFRVRAARAPE